MCGRFTFFASEDQIKQEFNVNTFHVDDWNERYNIAPTQEVTSIIQVHNEKRVGKLRWGLIPSWSQDKKIGSRLINARSETINNKPSFKRAFKTRRCIIPTTGFYEWRKLDDRKQPYFIYPGYESGLFGFAGLWEKWVDENDNSIFTCTIITTEANEIMEPLHYSNIELLSFLLVQR